MPTRKERVLKTLEANAPDWVPGWMLTDPSVGGSEGLRRVRELRSDGHVIEVRKRKGSQVREYRILIGDPGPHGTQLRLTKR